MYIHVMRMSVQTHSYTHTHAPAHMYMYTYICTHTHTIYYIPPRHLWPNESPFLAPNLARNLLHFWTSSHVRALSLSQPAPQREKQGSQWGEEHTSAPWESQLHDNGKSHEKWKMCFKASKTMEVLKQGWKQSWSKQTRRMCNFVIATHVPCLGFPQTTWNCLFPRNDEISPKTRPEIQQDLSF